MPDCKQCAWLIDKKCTGPELKQRNSLPIRKCINAYLMECCENLADCNRLLEVGVGANKNLRDICKKKNIEWHGADPRWKTEPNKQRYGYPVHDMPFIDQQFDCVFASQCMEHWEPRSDISAGLREIHRILRVGGLLFVDVPMGYHGGKAFIDGNIDAIVHKFDSTMWKLDYHTRRRNYEPLEPWYEKRVRKNPPSNARSAWILAIEAVRL